MPGAIIDIEHTQPWRGRISLRFRERTREGHRPPGGDRRPRPGHWLTALETVLAWSGLLSETDLDDRTRAVLATPKTANHHEAHREPVAVDPATR